MKYYLCHDYNVIVGDHHDPQPGLYSGFEHEERINHKFWITTEHPGYNLEETYDLEVPPKYLLYVLYYTGGTFGGTGGQHKIIQLGCENDYDEMSRKFDIINKNNGKNCKGKIGLNYIPWDGYFEHFESVHLIELDNKKEKHSI